MKTFLKTLAITGALMASGTVFASDESLKTPGDGSASSSAVATREQPAAVGTPKVSKASKILGASDEHLTQSTESTKSMHKVALLLGVDISVLKINESSPSNFAGTPASSGSSDSLTAPDASKKLKASSSNPTLEGATVEDAQGKFGASKLKRNASFSIDESKVTAPATAPAKKQ